MVNHQSTPSASSIPGHSGNNGTDPATLIQSFLPFSESNPNGIGPTEDDIALLWLADSSNTSSAVQILENNLNTAGVGEIFYGPSLTTMFNAPGLPPNGDPRTPDIIVTPNLRGGLHRQLAPVATAQRGPAKTVGRRAPVAGISTGVWNCDVLSCLSPDATPLLPGV
jgi:hypothetical protein